MKTIYSVLVLLVLSISFNGCLDDKPSDEELRKHVLNNDYLKSVISFQNKKRFSDSNGNTYVKLKIHKTNGIPDNNKYKIFYTCELVLTESPKKIPEEILKEIIKTECLDADNIKDDEVCKDYTYTGSFFLKENTKILISVE